MTSLSINNKNRRSSILAIFVILLWSAAANAQSAAVVHVAGPFCANSNIAFRYQGPACTSYYQWEIGGGGSIVSISGTVVVVRWPNATTTASVTSKHPGCPSGTTGNFTIQGSVAPSVTINAITTSVCAGTNAVFNSYPVNAGGNPSYQWELNGNLVNGATGSGFSTPSAPGIQLVRCRIISNETCPYPTEAWSNTVGISEVSGPLGPMSPISGPTTRCQGAGQTTYTASAANETLKFWTVSPLAAGSIDKQGVMTWNSDFSGNATITVSSLGCNGDQTQPVSTTVSVIGRPAAISGITERCDGDGPSTYTASITNATAYNWSMYPNELGSISSSGVVTWHNSIGGNAIIRVVAAACSQEHSPIALTVHTTPKQGTPAIPSGTASRCQGAGTSDYTTSANNATSYNWSLSPASAGTINSSGTVTWDPSFNGNATVSVTANGCGAPSPAAILNVTVAGTIATPSSPAGTTVRWRGAGTDTYTATAPNATGYYWNISPAAAGTINAGGTVTWSPTFSGIAVIGVSASGCNGTSNLSYTNVIVNTITAGTIVPSALTIVGGTSPGPLTGNRASGGTCNNNYSYQWQQGSGGGYFSDISGAVDQNYTPGVINSKTLFRRRAICGLDTQYTNICIISPVTAAFVSNPNYTRTRDVTMAGITSITGVHALTDAREVKQTTEYFDGLARLTQGVAKQASASQKDIVTLQTYDAFGRTNVEYLPYASSTIDGNYKVDAHAEQNAFNSNQFLNEKWYYGLIALETSPLNRPVANYGPGSSFTGSNRGITHQYLVNTATDDVQVFTIGTAIGSLPVHAGPYLPGQLSKKVTINEQGNATVEYVDKDEKVILKKIQLQNNPP
ncbi:MAG TPA: DUF6443 domain-containing protein, partial [Niastella sp.]